MAFHAAKIPLLFIVLVFSVLCSVVLGKGLLTAKAFFCRDPDTGKFYPVNSTWSSTTFCGSYTCKLKRVNHTIQNYPIREINVSDAQSNYVPSKSKAPKNTDKVLPLLPKTTPRNRNEQRGDVNYDNVEPQEKYSVTESTKGKPSSRVYHSKNVIDDSKLQNRRKESKYTTPARTHKHDNTHSPRRPNENNLPTRSHENNNKNVKDDKLQKKIEQLKTSLTKDDDRFLSSDEINTLTSVLKNVRKSDLEAILEVYNLAQDIYKEIDKNTDENLLSETDRPSINPENEKSNLISNVRDRSYPSYWYEPLSHAGAKQKIVQIHPGKLIPVLPPAPKKEHQVPIPPLYVPTRTADDESASSNKVTDPFLKPTHGYFMGSLTNNHFKKLPYYYPMQQVLIQPPYVQSREMNQKSAKPVSKNQKPRVNSGSSESSREIRYKNNAPRNVVVKNASAPQIRHPGSHSNSAEKHDKPKPSTTGNLFKVVPDMGEHISFLDDPKALLTKYTHPYKKAPTILPYQFAFVHYNLSSTPNVYPTLTNKWHKYNVKTPKHDHPKTNDNSYTYDRPQPQSYDAQNYIHPKFLAIPNAVLVNPELTEEADRIIEQRPVAVSREDKLPSWQTAPLPMKVIDEVKANIVPKTKLLPIPIRKKVRLERVSKVIKMDDPVRKVRSIKKEVRVKRETKLIEEEKVNHDVKREADRVRKEVLMGKQVTEEFEVFLEKSTCAIDMEPGFFKIGNTSLPFPSCCPQRIR